MNGDVRRVLIALVMVGVGFQGQEARGQEPVTFPATDGATVHGYLYQTDPDSTRVLILAFHQGRANGRGEYGPIASRLNDAGYDLLAIDQRSGGDLFGGENRTAAEHGESSYCEVAPDLAGTLRYARQARPDVPIVLWGSSYTGALALRLAATNPEGVVGVLGFSPASGGPMAECRAGEVSGQIEVPVLVLRPKSEMEIESSRLQFERFGEQGHSTFVSDPGTHGSSMLVEARVEGSVGGNVERGDGFPSRSRRPVDGGLVPPKGGARYPILSRQADSTSASRSSDTPKRLSVVAQSTSRSRNSSMILFAVSARGRNVSPAAIARAPLI